MRIGQLPVFLGNILILANLQFAPACSQLYCLDLVSPTPRQLCRHIHPDCVTSRISLWVPTATQLYAAVATSGGDTFDSVYISTNGGSSWTAGGDLPKVGGKGCLDTNQANYNLALGGDPSTPDTVFVGLIGLYRSTDGGVTWSYTLDQAHPDFHAVAVNRGVIYALNDGGLATSTNGVNWSEAINSGLATLQFTGAALGPQTASLAYGGMQDNDLAIYTGNPQWTSGNTVSDGGFTAIPKALARKSRG